MMVSQVLDIQLSHHRGILTTLKIAMGSGVASFLPSLPPSSSLLGILVVPMDDSADVDLVGAPPIGNPDRFQVSLKQLWRTGGPHDSGAENDADSCNGSPQWLPHPSRNIRRLKHLTLDTNLPPPLLYSPGYPSTVKGTPLSSRAFDYFDLGGESLLPPAKVDDEMGFPNLLIYVREVPLVMSTTELLTSTIANRVSMISTIRTRGISIPVSPHCGTQGTTRMRRSLQMNPQTTSPLPASHHQNSSRQSNNSTCRNLALSSLISLRMWATRSNTIPS